MGSKPVKGSYQHLIVPQDGAFSTIHKKFVYINMELKINKQDWIRVLSDYKYFFFFIKYKKFLDFEKYSKYLAKGGGKW